MHKLLALATAFGLAANFLNAQPQPCGPAPEMTSFCNQACIICDINGFTGINDDPEEGQAPPGFCTSTVHHMQWIGFIAGSTNLTLNVKVFNCQTSQGYGLEVGIYKSLDCENFELVSNCDGDVMEGETGVFTNTAPLTIGQYYYFVMDGNHDDVCQYTINVVSGTTAVAKLPTSGVLAGDFSVCPDRTEKYTLSAPKGATWFSWTLDGAPVYSGIDTTLTLNWNAPGSHLLCATASNVCDTAPPVCQLIEVTPIPPTHLAASICPGDCWQGADTTICNPGFYSFHFAGHEGCDSMVTVAIDYLPTNVTSLDLMICKGDTLHIGPDPYFDTGQFQSVLTNQFGCDSTVNLDLLVIVCEIRGELEPEPVDCYGQPTGGLHFKVVDGTPPFDYSWEQIGPGPLAGTGSISAVNSEINIPNLPQGTYFVTITDHFGHDLVLFGDVTEPLPLEAVFDRPDRHGHQVSCAGGSDGWLEILPAGGKKPYTYHWNTGAQSARLENLSIGAYACTVTDVSGCTFTTGTVLTEPAPLGVTGVFTDPDCSGFHSGTIRVSSAAGGITPYQYTLNGGSFSVQDTFSNLTYGLYTLTLRDANGCTTQVSDVLDKPLIPHIFLGPDITISLGESTPLHLLSNVPLQSISWTPATGLSCADCPKPDATPYHTTTYTAAVVSEINHCTDVDSLTVFVQERRNVYIPNTFSPNDDGSNDHFTVYGGPEVRMVRSLQVWSRWGELVFEASDIAANAESSGWDGYFRGKLATPGVFTWMATVEFVDNLTLHYQGDVTVVR